MKKILLILVVLLTSSVIYPQNCRFQGLSKFYGFDTTADASGLASGFRLTGYANCNNWKSISGLILESGGFSGSRLCIEVINEKRVMDGCGFLHANVPVRKVTGKITVTNVPIEGGVKNMVLEGTFNIIQGLEDKDYQFSYESNGVVTTQGYSFLYSDCFFIVEGMYRDCKVSF